MRPKVGAASLAEHERSSCEAEPAPPCALSWVGTGRSEPGHLALCPPGPDIELSELVLMCQEGQPPTPSCSDTWCWAWGWQVLGRHQHEGEPAGAWVALPQDRAGQGDQTEPAARCVQRPGSCPHTQHS